MQFSERIVNFSKLMHLQGVALEQDRLQVGGGGQQQEEKPYADHDQACYWNCSRAQGELWTWRKSSLEHQGI